MDKKACSIQAQFKLTKGRFSEGISHHNTTMLIAKKTWKGQQKEEAAKKRSSRILDILLLTPKCIRK